MNSIQENYAIGQATWIDYMRRGMITSGELRRLIHEGIAGVTSNPIIFEKAIAGSDDYDAELLELAEAGKSKEGVYESLATEDIASAADLLLPVYERSEGVDGCVSLEVSPFLAHDARGTVAEAKRLFTELDRPNVMIKVPATSEGIPAIRHLIAEGINVNVTLIFSLDHYQQVREAYIAGLEAFADKGGEPGRVSSVASFFLSRVDTVVDNLLQERIDEGDESLKALLGKTAISNAKVAYRDFKRTFGEERFLKLKGMGARVQRPLWASTSTKNPAYSDVLYVETIIGPDTVNTMPPATLNAFLDHGRSQATIERDLEEAEGVLQSLQESDIDMTRVTADLLDDGIKKFWDSMQSLLDNVEDKMQRLLEPVPAFPGISLGEYLQEVMDTVEDLREKDIVRRIWKKDFLVWKPEPTGIKNRLGWLNVTELISDQLEELVSFAAQVKDEWYQDVVLLGMGGSSLGPEVLRQTFGEVEGYPRLTVLDSTVPAAVHAVVEAVDPARTLFLVSSKSGGTIETLSLYACFWSQVAREVGEGEAGRNFIAITDPGTSLAELAGEKGFRRVFLNPSDIGGRYSVLSCFGLVPAALMGMDIMTLVDMADRLREGCAPCASLQHNPGVFLGAAMGTFSLQGRDKLTLVTSPAISSFGLWVEQLLAESTGKEGKGILPVAGEPLKEPAAYGDDRLFVCVRLQGDDNAALDGGVKPLLDSGQPLIGFDLREPYELGSEFFRWEFATAVAGSMLGINAFDQPNVQLAKDMTARVLKEYQQSDRLPREATTLSFRDLLQEGAKGDYLAIMAYLRQRPELDQAFAELRGRVMEKRRIATTLGYGPRFLHSTGQLHKGGPDTGLFLQITSEHAMDIPIPGKDYSFGVLADAEALGDLRALQARGRRVVKVHLNADDPEAVRALADEVL